MGLEIKLKEKHYKKKRFGNKSEKELSEFKKNNISQDLAEKQEKGIDFLKANYQVLTTKNKIKLPLKNQVTCIRTQSQLNILTLFLQIIEQEKQINFLSIQTYTMNEKTIFALVNLIQTNGNNYVLDGSGNFSMNAQIEHYNIFNSKELFDFDNNWQKEFFFSKKLRKNHEIYKNF